MNAGTVAAASGARRPRWRNDHDPIKPRIQAEDPSARRRRLPRFPAAQPGTTTWWPWIAGAAALLLLLQVGLLLWRKRKSAGHPGDVAGAEVERSDADWAAEDSSPAAALSVSQGSTVPAGLRVRELGSHDFDRALSALESLAPPEFEDVPALIEALDSRARTPFHKIRGKPPSGLTATRAESGGGLPVRHIAPLLLSRVLGKPPVERPTRRDWEDLWHRPPPRRMMGPAVSPH